MSTLLTGDNEPAIDPAETSARRVYDATYAEPARATSPNGEITALRADPARVMYSAASMYGDAVLDQLARATNAAGDSAELAQQRVELGAVCQDLGLSGADIQQLAGIVARNVATPPTAEQLAANRRDAIAALRHQYGVADFDSALRDAQTVVQRDALGCLPELCARFGMQ